MTWHLDDRSLGDYAEGDADAMTSNSVEQHVVRCAECRGRLNTLVDDPALGAVWERVLDSVQAPRPALVERILRRVGLPPEDALLLWTAPAFRAPWLASTLITLVFVTLAALASQTRGLMLFVLVAPLLPVAGVALAYGPDADPAHEVTVPTPYPALRLVLLRSVAVLATTVPLTLVAGLLLPGGLLFGVAWLAPSMAAVAVTLAFSTWLSVTRAATCVAGGWAALAAVLAGPGWSSPGLSLEAPFIPAYVVLALASTVVLVARGDRLAHIGGTS